MNLAKFIATKKASFKTPMIGIACAFLSFRRVLTGDHVLLYFSRGIRQP